MDTIADRIKQALVLRNMKQADLVKATGIGKSSISTYLTGAYEPKQKNIYKIARALNVSEAWLMGYETDADLKELPESLKTQELTAHEIKIALAYRQATDKEKEVVETVLKDYLAPEQAKTATAG